MKEYKFKQRPLAPIKGVSIPKVWLFTDTETFVESVDGEDRHLFRLGWIFLCHPGWEKDKGDHSEWFFDSELSYLQFINKTARDNNSVVLCGHNIFFDLQAAGFFRHFSRWNWDLEYMYDHGMTFILKIRLHMSTITILSTTNWFDCSLSDLGIMLGLEKLEVDFDHCSKAQLKSYCHRDTEIVMGAMRYYLKFIVGNGLGRFCFTRSSQALTAYRKRFMAYSINVHDDERVHELERQAYMGGRTEAYRIGAVRGKSFVTLDINSMYPYVMQKYRYPSKLVGYIEDEPDVRYTELLGGYLMIAEVELETPDPVFAVRYRGKTVFPVGRFTAFLCTEAIKYGVECGYIKRFVRASVYLPEDLFSWHVEFFRSLRDDYVKDGNEVMQRLCKYMHNSLYGKFGERKVVNYLFEDDEDREYWRDEIIDGEDGSVWIETYLFGKRLLQHYEGETPHSAPAIAAHITENARMELWSLITSIGRGNVLYCDTDSVIVRENVLPGITWPVDQDAMGALKVQSHCTKLTIDGAKNYRTDEERHIKGIPASAKEVAPGVFEYMSFRHMCLCLRMGCQVGVPQEIVRRRLVSKYDKGIVTSSGRVEPLSFPLPFQPDGLPLPF